MSTVNSIVIVGRLGQDPEIRATKNGMQVASFSVATDRYGRDVTDWHRVTCFAEQADFAAAYLRKGSLVAVLGRVEYTKKEKDGATVTYTDVIARSVQAIGGKAENPNVEQTETVPSGGPDMDPDSDLPF